MTWSNDTIKHLIGLLNNMTGVYFNNMFCINVSYLLEASNLGDVMTIVGIAV
jgi:hypothetical protein